MISKNIELNYLSFILF